MYETYAPIWCQTPTFVKSAYREYLIRFLRKFFIFGANLETFIKSLYFLSCMTLVSVTSVCSACYIDKYDISDIVGNIMPY